MEFHFVKIKYMKKINCIYKSVNMMYLLKKLTYDTDY
jgi:hypothetical protein